MTVVAGPSAAAAAGPHIAKKTPKHNQMTDARPFKICMGALRFVAVAARLLYLIF